jgi:hypothetical protein
MQAGERQLHLGLDPGGSEDATLRPLLLDVVQQRRLADPCLASQHQDPALAGPDVFDDPVEGFALAATASQHLFGKVTHHRFPPCGPPERSAVWRVDCGGYWFGAGRGDSGVPRRRPACRDATVTP